MQLEVGTQAYRSHHTWLCRNFMKTGLCVSCGKTGKTDWAKIGVVHSRNREDYQEMCRSCHKQMDGPKVCQFGHPLEGDNIKGGTRKRCRTCVNANWRKRYHERKYEEKSQEDE